MAGLSNVRGHRPTMPPREVGPAHAGDLEVPVVRMVRPHGAIAMHQSARGRGLIDAGWITFAAKQEIAAGLVDVECRANRMQASGIWPARNATHGLDVEIARV